MIYTYEDKHDVSIETMTYLFLFGGDPSASCAINDNTGVLTVSTTLDETTSGIIVDSYDSQELLVNKVTKVQEIDNNTTMLVSDGIFYQSSNMPVDAASKSLYSSVKSDSQDPQITISYPVQFPSLGGGALVVEDEQALADFISVVNDRLIYLYEDQENADGSYGLVAYGRLIFACTTQEELDAIKDTRV